MSLSQEQIDAFFTDGFIELPGLFAAAEVAQMDEATRRLEATAQTLDEPATVDGSRFVVEPIPPGTANPDQKHTKPPHRIHRVQWAGAAEPILMDFGCDPRLLAIAGQLLGTDELVHLINQVHFKFPFDGVAFPWHQDSQFRRYGTELWSDPNGKGSYVQIAVAIDEMTPNNGPLEFIPGSCQWGHLGLDKLAKEAAEDTAQPAQTQLTASYSLPPQLRAQVRVEDAVSLTLSAGSGVAFGPYTIHRSLPNEGDQPRRVFINGYAYPGANKREYPGAGTGVLRRL